MFIGRLYIIFVIIDVFTNYCVKMNSIKYVLTLLETIRVLFVKL